MMVDMSQTIAKVMQFLSFPNVSFDIDFTIHTTHSFFKHIIVDISRYMSKTLNRLSKWDQELLEEDYKTKLIPTSLKLRTIMKTLALKYSLSNQRLFVFLSETFPNEYFKDIFSSNLWYSERERERASGGPEHASRER